MGRERNAPARCVCMPAPGNSPALPQYNFLLCIYGCTYTMAPVEDHVYINMRFEGYSHRSSKKEETCLCVVNNSYLCIYDLYGPVPRPKKVEISRAQPSPICPRNGCCQHQKHYAQGRINPTLWIKPFCFSFPPENSISKDWKSSWWYQEILHFNVRACNSVGSWVVLCTRAHRGFQGPYHLSSADK